MKTKKKQNSDKSLRKKQEKRRQLWNRYKYMTLPLVIYFLLIIIKFPAILNEYKLDKHGIETTAIVDKIIRVKGKNPSYAMYYRYPVKNRWYKNRRKMYQREYSKGDTVRIKYLPEDPKTSLPVKHISYEMSITRKIFPFLN